MKTRITLFYSLSLVMALSFTFNQKAEAQHPTPVDMLYQPLDDFFRFSGGGGGNLYGLFKASGAASGILSLDGNWNIGEKIANAKRKINTLMVDFKIHPFINTALRSADSIDVRRFAFQDNDFRLQFGARFTNLKEREKNPNTGSKTFAQGFLDIIIVPYQIENSIDPTNNKGFTSLSLNMGGKFGVMGKFMGGTFGITANPQLDLLFIMNGPNSTALEEVTNGNLSALQLSSIPKTARGYVAGGVKIEIPLNDFILSFDIRRYFKMGSGAELEGLTNNTLFSIGGIAMGSIFKNRTKKGRKTNKKNK